MENSKPPENKDGIKQIFLSEEDKQKISDSIKKDIKKDVIKWYIKWFIVVIPAVVGLMGVYLGIQISVPDIYRKVNKSVTDLITKNFAEPKIAKTLNEVAENQAQEIIKNNLNPAIKQATSDIKVKIGSFETILKNFKDKYDSELEKLVKEVDYIKNRNNVLKLGDETIATGDAASFEKLDNIYKSSSDNDIKMTALSEIFRIKSHFATMTRIKGVEIKYTDDKSGKEFTEKDIPTGVLIQGLKEAQPWQYRARIAELLKEKKEKQVPEALLNALRNDDNLEVRKKAMDSFEAITNFKSRDVFNYDSAKEWWEKNKQEVEGKLN
ncbi:MAG: HEAT repeat domain-containing protein [Candidatus Omnitrophota bacterium]